MQTFLPYRNFEKVAACLDWRRLGKQRVEAMQIICVLDGVSNGWRNHPAVKMWAGHRASLAYYHNVMIDEWVARGYRNTMKRMRGVSQQIPSWIDSGLVRSHRSNLLRKDYEHYSQFGWQVPDNLPYRWPV